VKRVTKGVTRFTMAVRRTISATDVAKHAQVSRTTVSYVLNERSDVSIPTATREHVLKIARDLGYQPNRAARALVTGRTHMVALYAERVHTPVAASILYHFQKEAAKHGFDVTVGTNLSRFVPQVVDGILAIDSPTSIQKYIEENGPLNLPFVSIGPYFVDSVDYVGVDFATGTQQALEHLVSVGCRRITFFYDGIIPDFENAVDPRCRTYAAFMKEHNLPAEYVRVPYGSPRHEARTTIREYVRNSSQLPDALFCRYDELAIGAYCGLRAEGIRVPEDIAMVGCDGIEEMEFLETPLSTIVQPFEHLCVEGWKFLKQRMEEPGLPQQTLLLPPHLEVRASSLR
jgi:LacI family transcriptional regulator